MCVVSAIMDQWDRHIPMPSYPWPPPTVIPGQPTVIPITVPSTGTGTGTLPAPFITFPPSVAEDGTPNDVVRELIETLKQALAAAERLDELTGQPDCVDPEKAKLMDRVAVLERRLDEIGGLAEADHGERDPE